MVSLYEAIILVVIVSLVGFWEWRSALLMALAIPITLAMTFGMMHMLNIDLQQISIATLIIALGLLVDDPVVAGDSIKRELGAGHTSLIAAWLGPTKLAGAILFATITNIVAYLPFLSVGGDTGAFLYSMPVVITCSLVASRLASMTFIPLLGYYMIKPKKELPISERRKKGFAAWYYRVGTAAINHRWKVLAGSLVFLALGVFFMSQLKTQFFPKDLSYLSYVDVWLPEDAPLEATNRATIRAEAVIRDVFKEYGDRHAEAGKPRELLRSLTTFVGGGGPRFWFSVSPEQQQLNYAQIIVEVTDKHETGHLVAPLQEALSAKIPEARIDVRQLESGKAVGLPVAIRISGDDVATLRAKAEQVMNIFRSIPEAARPARRLGRREFLGEIADGPGPGESYRHHESGRGGGLGHGVERLLGHHAARRRQADSCRREAAHGGARAARRHQQPLRLLVVRAPSGCRSGRYRRFHTRCRPRSCDAEISSARSPFRLRRSKACWRAK